MNILDMKFVDFEIGMKFEANGEGTKRWTVTGKKPRFRSKPAMIFIKSSNGAFAEMDASKLPSMIARILSSPEKESA